MTKISSILWGLRKGYMVINFELTANPNINVVPLKY